MNIVEAYIKFNGQLIVLISGLSGSGISMVSSYLSEDLKLPHISHRSYQKTEGLEEITVGDKKTYNYDSDDSIDWDKFIDDINEKKHTGIIVSSKSFPNTKISSLGDHIHINIKLSKQNLLKKRLEYVQSKDEEMDELDKEAVQLFNKYTYPYYMMSISPEKANIDKFINANNYVELQNEEYLSKVYDDVFDYVMYKINLFLDNYQNKNSKSGDNTNKYQRSKNREGDKDGDKEGDDELANNLGNIKFVENSDEDILKSSDDELVTNTSSELDDSNDIDTKTNSSMVEDITSELSSDFTTESASDTTDSSSDSA